MAQRIPHISEPLTETLADGRIKITDNWHRFLDALSVQLTNAEGQLPGGGGQAAGTLQDWQESVLIEFAEDKDYRFLDWAFEWTITSVVTQSQAGTCTLTVKINSTALGGTANSVSTSEQTQAHSTNNVVAAGDNIVLTISSNSSAEGVSVTLKGTRTLD